MTTCLMERAPVPSPRACAGVAPPHGLNLGVKRLRAHSEGAVAASKFERLLKTHKHLSTDSPCSIADVLSTATTQPQQSNSQQQQIHLPTLGPSQLPQLPQHPHHAAPLAPWPAVTACESIKYSLAFLQDSRLHAMALLAQDEWPRAMTVLEKVERANDMVARQRRRMVLEQANAGMDALRTEAEEQPTERSANARVRFSDETAEVPADDCDRSPVRVPLLVREEILILRASRTIPAENYSEFWP